MVSPVLKKHDADGSIASVTDVSTQSGSDRSMSPNTMNEEDRRELIARQHRALYGNEAAPFSENGSPGDSGHTPRPMNQNPNAQGSAVGGARGPSPLAYDPFGMSQGQGQNQASSGSGDNKTQMSSSEHSAQQPATSSGPSPAIPQQPQQRSRANSTSSPSSNPAGFSLFDSTAQQQSSRTSTSSPGGSPPRQASKASNAPIGSGVAPIGTRPGQGGQAQASNPALGKRSTTPLPSPLSYGFAPNEETNANERSTSAASNPPAGNQEQPVNLGWGSKSAVWGNKGSLGVQASVWG